MGYAATIGFFDGVHTGHRFLLSQLRQSAAAKGLLSAVVTFAQHPETVLHNRPKPLLTTFDERTERLRDSGLDEVFCFQFPVVCGMSAAEFMRVLHDHCGVEMLLMGYDHRFGSDRLDNFAAYQQEGAAIGLQVLPVPCAPQGQVSSSGIRRALLAGNIAVANDMLGYPYTLSGVVAHGRAIGRTIGFPTANITPAADKLLPADGVYAVRAHIVENQYETQQLALLNIGTNPTVDGVNKTLEVHIPDFSGDLYGRTLRLELLSRLRDERRFDSLDDLREQIKNDLTKLAAR